MQALTVRYNSQQPPTRPTTPKGTKMLITGSQIIIIIVIYPSLSEGGEHNEIGQLFRVDCREMSKIFRTGFIQIASFPFLYFPLLALFR